MQTQTQFNHDLIEFLNDSPTPFHAVRSIVARLEEKGFQPLDEAAEWQLQAKGRYYVTRNDSSIVAFINGDTGKGIRMVGAHTDSPCLKVKPNPELIRCQYLQLGVEVYGGALLNPWFDRDLSLAGRVQYLTDSGELKSGLIDYRKAIAFIPSLAIHLDREANKNRSINPQTDIPPVLCQLGEEETLDFRGILKDQLTAEGYKDVARVLEFDLSFYDTHKPAIIGLNDEFIVGARLDNLLSCYIGLQALLTAADSTDATVALVCNDHEEIGSQSAVGAQGPMLRSILERICGSSRKMTQVMANSVVISTDNAHGVHPNYADRHDENHGPQLNKGAVIKVNANQRYATSDRTSAMFRLLCESRQASFQHFVTRTDLGCGSTIGPLTAGELGVKVLDVGLPTFGMHSIRETCGIRDAFELSDVLSQFYTIDTLPV